MRPIRLEMSAFGPYADKQVIDFTRLEDRNFFLIYGPTGAGKTSILDAMCYALYGGTSGELRSGEAMRSDYATLDVPTYVVFDFSIGQKKYRITRSPGQEVRKKRGEGTKWENAKAELCLYDEKGQLQQIAVKEVTKQVEQLLGFKSEQFRQVVLLPQGDFRKLLIATSTERQKIMQTLFHTELYSYVEEVLKEKEKEVKLQYEETVKRIEQKLTELQATTIEEIEKQIEEGKSQCLVLEKKSKEKKESHMAAQQEYQKKQQVEDRFLRIEKSKATLKELEEKKEAVLFLEKEVLRMERALHLKDRCLDISKLEENGRKMRKELDKYKEKASKYETDLHEQELRKKALEEEGKEREKEREELIKLQSLRPVLQEWLLLGKEIEQVAVKEEALKKDWEIVKKEVQVNIEKIKGLEEEKKEVSEKIRKKEHILQDFEKAKIWKAQEEKIVEEALALQELEKRKEEFTHKGEIAKAEVLQKRHVYEGLYALYTQGQAMLLSKGLEEGRPCPVCGSLHHPHKAIAEEAVPSWEEVEKAQQQWEDVQQQFQEIEKEEKNVQGIWEEKKKQYTLLVEQVPSIDTSWAEEERRLQQEATSYKHDKEELQEKELALEQWQRKWKQSVEAEEKSQQSYTELALHLQSIRVSWEEKQKQIPELYREKEQFYHRITKLEQGLAAYDAAVKDNQLSREKAKTDMDQATKEVQVREEEIKERREEYFVMQREVKARLEKAGFHSREDCMLWVEKSKDKEKVQREIQAYYTAVGKEEKTIEEEQKNIGNEERPQMGVYENRRMNAAEEMEKAIQEEAQAKEKLEVLCKGYGQIQSWQKEFGAFDQQYKIVSSLSELARGKNTGVAFERYVLGALLEDVMVAANERLREMSRSRYMLQRSDTRADKRFTSGLDIAVFDQYTGYSRAANTLSGGETFLASLSLALGLADVVQAYSGGIHLDTIFIDEGFGTLDAETLDFALKALLELKEGGRLVGIISHVPELQERISTRLKIRKTDRGSQAIFELS